MTSEIASRRLGSSGPTVYPLALSWIGFDARPAPVKNFAPYSLSRLGVDHIDIYRPARIDPPVPIEETIGAVSEPLKAGFVRYVGLSEWSFPRENSPALRKRFPRCLLRASATTSTR